jgi:hypothetical protein
MWRVFSKQAGFRVELMQIVVRGEGLPNPVDTPDPADAGRRLEIGATSGPAYILVAATKVEAKNDEYIPMQSDYMRNWAGAEGRKPGEYVPDTHNRE